MLIFIAEILIVAAVEIFILLLVFQGVEKHYLSIWQAVGVGAVPLLTGSFVAVKHFRPHHGTCDRLKVHLNKLESRFEIGTHHGNEWYSVNTTLRAKFE